MALEKASNNDLPEYVLDHQGEPVWPSEMKYWRILQKKYDDVKLPEWVIKRENEVLEANEMTNKTDTKPVNTGGAKWMAYMGHIAHTEFENLKTEMLKFEAPYVMSAEDGAYEHFHFLAKLTDRQYYNFCKRVFKDKYKLRGRAVADKPRQYGKVQKIKDLSKMMAYTIKDKNFATNMTTEEIEAILNKKIEEVENTKHSDSGEIKE